MSSSPFSFSHLRSNSRWFTRPLAGALSIAFTLPLFSLAKPAQAQVGGAGQACYAIADNNPAGGSDGGRNIPDSLAIIDFSTRNVTNLGRIVNDADGSLITNIEAATSRPDFNELIVANGSEIGRLDPRTSRYTALGTLAPFTDFDAIAVDRQSPNQTRLIGVSKDSSNPELNNIIVETTLIINSAGLTTGIGPITRRVAIPNEQFPSSATGIDGIAVTDGGTVLGVANRGPDVNNGSEQILVNIDIDNGTIQRLGVFQDTTGALINDVEDISIDLFGDLFISSGSNFSNSTNTAYIITLNPDGQPGRATNSLSLAAAGQDFEASACLRTITEDENALLVVKRITAVSREGVETRFDQFVDQPNETTDNQLSDLTNGAFPLGEFETPTTLLPGDEVEYTVYVYNPTPTAVGNIILCDPIQPPSVLQSSSVSFSNPAADLTLAFNDRAGFARAPLAPADSACEAVVTGDQFPSGPPGPTGGLDVGAGGGVVTDQFLLPPRQISATRFRITVGQSNSE